MTLIGANAILVAILGLLYLVGPVPPLAPLVLVVWGLVGFGLVPSLQLRVIGLAGRAGDLAATLGASAVNAGIAAGALIGGRVVAAQGVRDVAFAGAAMCLIALPAAIATRSLEAPAPGEPLPLAETTP